MKGHEMSDLFPDPDPFSRVRQAVSMPLWHCMYDIASVYAFMYVWSSG